jgi:hypothetical protein
MANVLLANLLWFQMDLSGIRICVMWARRGGLRVVSAGLWRCPHMIWRQSETMTSELRLVCKLGTGTRVANTQPGLRHTGRLSHSGRIQLRGSFPTNSPPLDVHDRVCDLSSFANDVYILAQIILKILLTLRTFPPAFLLVPVRYLL